MHNRRFGEASFCWFVSLALSIGGLFSQLVYGEWALAMMSATILFLVLAVLPILSQAIRDAKE